MRRRQLLCSNWIILLFCSCVFDSFIEIDAAAFLHTKMWKVPDMQSRAIIVLCVSHRQVFKEWLNNKIYQSAKTSQHKNKYDLMLTTISSHCQGLGQMSQ